MLTSGHRLHGVQGGGEGEREFVEMALEIAVAGEASPRTIRNNRRRVGLQRLAMARTLRSTYREDARGSGRMISWRLILS